MGLLNKKITAKKVLERLIGNFKEINNPLFQGADAVKRTILEFTNFYDDALEELEHIVNKKRILVLIDSIERYEFHDRIVLAVLNALSDICVEFCNNKIISVKAALPSELVPNLLSQNLEKILNKMVYIRWNQADLKALIAVRVFKYKKGINGAVNQAEAIEFFDNYYDEFCDTEHGFRFRTFAYCMSYTQKKPRQMISIFNTWLNLENNFCKKNKMSLIENAITQNEIARVQGAFSIYCSIHTDMFEMFKKTFTNRKYCFTNQEFDLWLKDCSSIRGSLDAYDLKKYFIASGLVGVMVELHRIEKDTSPFNNDRIIRIKEVLFEYQFKERLSFNKETKFCLHPMCFRVLSSEIDRNTLVYPKPLEMENEYIPWKQEDILYE